MTVGGYFLIPRQKFETEIGDTQKIKFARLPCGNIREVLRTHGRWYADMSQMVFGYITDEMLHISFLRLLC